MSNFDIIPPQKKIKQAPFSFKTNKAIKKSFQWFLNQAITVFSCVLIIALGIAVLTHANTGTTTIGENISTGGNLTVAGNATTTGSYYIGSDLSVLGNASTTGTFTLSGIANFLSDLIVSGNATTTGIFNVSGNTKLATTTFSGDLDLSQKELKQAVLEKLTTFPSSPTQGQMFYSTASSTPYWYTGSEWKGDVSGATFIVAASDSKNKEKADYIGDGTADDVEIQAALDALPSGGGKVQLMEGTFNIAATITLNASSTLQGVGWNTILDISSLSSSGYLITMDTSTVLSNLMIQGDIDPLQTSRHQIYAGDHSIIEKIYIFQSFGGIETTDKINVHIRDVRFDNIKDSNGWASAIHNSGTSKNIFIDGVYISDSDRGIETEDGAKNVYAKHGYIYNVPAMALDVHNHSGLGGVENVVYEDFYLENTNQLNASGVSGSESDIAKNITFRNITLKNSTPNSGLGVVHVSNAVDVLIDNVRIFGDSFSQSSILRVLGSTNVTFNKIDVTNDGGSSLQFTNSTSTVIKNSRFSGGLAGSGYLASVKNCVGALFDNVLFDGYVHYGGLQIESTCSRVQVINSTFIASSTPGNYGIANNADYTTIANNTFLYASPYAIDVDADYARIYGNYFTGQLQTGSVAEGTVIYDNDFTGGGGITDNGTNTIIRDNRGYLTATSSTATITSGNTYVAVTHGLDITPTASTISILPLEDLGNASTTNFWISDIGASTFRINVGTDPGKDVDFSWQIGSY